MQKQAKKILPSFFNVHRTLWSRINIISDSLIYRNVLIVTTPIICYSKLSILFFLYPTLLRHDFFLHPTP